MVLHASAQQPMLEAPSVSIGSLMLLLCPCQHHLCAALPPSHTPVWLDWLWKGHVIQVGADLDDTGAYKGENNAIAKDQSSVCSSSHDYKVISANFPWVPPVFSKHPVYRWDVN